MKLIINRSKNSVKGVFGGAKGMMFTSAYKLVLSPVEAELVEKYNLRDYVLTDLEVSGHTLVGETIGKLMAGSSSVADDLSKLIREETIIKDACSGLPSLFDFCRSFDHGETIEYSSEKAG